MKFYFAVVILLVGIAIFSAVSCTTSEQEVQSTLSSYGFTDIKVYGVQYFGGCGREDKPGRTFRAMNSNNVQVGGIVCCGRPSIFPKACTVRF